MSAGDLQARARRVLAQASIIAEAPTASLGESISHSKPEDRVPVMQGAPVFDEIVRLLAGANGDLETAVSEAELLVDAVRYSRRQVDTKTVEGRLIVGLDSRPVRTVARIYGYSPSHVHRLRSWAHETVEALTRKNAG